MGVKEWGTEAGSQRVSVLVQMKVNFLALEVGKKVKAEAIPFLAVRGPFHGAWDSCRMDKI